MMSTLYLLRHATPDWNRKDIRYDVPPGPDLVARGQAEARQLGQFLKQVGVRRVFYSPMQRAAQTALIAAGVAGIPTEEKAAIVEWSQEEDEAAVLARLAPFWEVCVQRSEQEGPLALLSHGGPVRLMLTHLGIAPALLEEHSHRYDYPNPIPPAGAWKIKRANGSGPWSFEMVFAPRVD